MILIAVMKESSSWFAPILLTLLPFSCLYILSLANPNQRRSLKPGVHSWPPTRLSRMPMMDARRTLASASRTLSSSNIRQRLSSISTPLKPVVAKVEYVRAPSVVPRSNRSPRLPRTAFCVAAHAPPASCPRTCPGSGGCRCSPSRCGRRRLSSRRLYGCSSGVSSSRSCLAARRAADNATSPVSGTARTLRFGLYWQYITCGRYLIRALNMEGG